jgi:hypothetical protein
MKHLGLGPANRVKYFSKFVLYVFLSFLMPQREISLLIRSLLSLDGSLSNKNLTHINWCQSVYTSEVGLLQS